MVIAPVVLDGERCQRFRFLRDESVVPPLRESDAALRLIVRERYRAQAEHGIEARHILLHVLLDARIGRHGDGADNRRIDPGFQRAVPSESDGVAVAVARRGADVLTAYPGPGARPAMRARRHLPCAVEGPWSRPCAATRRLPHELRVVHFSSE